MLKQEVRIGLALSGGVARGPAHIGVLRVLEQAGIPIHCVAGTSAGSIVGAAYCAGLSVDALEEMALTGGWQNIVRLQWPRHGLVSFAGLEPWLESMIGVLDVRDLALPFTAVATDLESGEPVVLKQGRLAAAVHASCAVPGLVEPVEINGRLLCDGGVSCNLPAKAARQMGADYVIGVDLFVPRDGKRWGPLGAGAAAIETMIRNTGGGVKESDCLIKPDISGFSYFRFSQARQFIAYGEAAAHAALPKIQADLAQLSKEQNVMMGEEWRVAIGD